VLIQDTTTGEFLEKNAMGWGDSPRRRLARGNGSSRTDRLSRYTLGENEGWSKGFRAEQYKTEENSNSVSDGDLPGDPLAATYHHEFIAPLTV